MPENPHANEDLEGNSEKLCEEEKKTPENSERAADRRTGSYYYDDAHGYEIYDPDEDDAEK